MKAAKERVMLRIGTMVNAPVLAIAKPNERPRPDGIGLRDSDPFRFTIGGRDAAKTLVKLSESRRNVKFSINLGRKVGAVKFGGYVSNLRRLTRAKTLVTIVPTLSYSFDV